MASRRRGAGEGGVYQGTRYRRRASGEPVEHQLCVGVVEADRDATTGQRRRVKVKVKAKAEALRKMRAEQDRIGAGEVPQDPSMTLERFLRSWTTDVLPHRVGQATVANHS